MTLVFEKLPHGFTRTGEDSYEYDPADYYDELRIQMEQWFQDICYDEFKKSLNVSKRRHMLQYFRLRKWNELYQRCLSELYEE